MCDGLAALAAGMVLTISALASSAHQLRELVDDVVADDAGGVRPCSKACSYFRVHICTPLSCPCSLPQLEQLLHSADAFLLLEHVSPRQPYLPMYPLIGVGA